ncbi:hypothetical protein ACP70R_041448 [Stipagrostis hirtigluma subsp. patula]
MEWLDEVKSVKTTKVDQRKGGCGIHQTVTTTLIPTYHPDDDEKLMALIAAASAEIDDSDYSSVVAQVSAIEAVVARVNYRRVDDAMSRVAKRVEKLESELAELKRELERRGKTTLIGTVAGAFLPDGIASKLRGVRDLLNAVLGE